jgi:hypothetical protein
MRVVTIAEAWPAAGRRFTASVDPAGLTRGLRR